MEPYFVSIRIVSESEGQIDICIEPGNRTVRAVTGDREGLEEFIALVNRSGVSPTHVDEIIEDFLQ